MSRGISIVALALKHSADQANIVLAEALINVQEDLGLTQEQVSAILGVDRSTYSRIRSRMSIDANSKSGELATLLIRIYRSLYVLLGADKDNMRHWLRSPNSHLMAKPLEMLATIQGLVQVLEYLDAFRGKI